MLEHLNDDHSTHLFEVAITLLAKAIKKLIRIVPNPIFALVLIVACIELEDFVISKVPSKHRGQMSAEKPVILNLQNVAMTGFLATRK